MADGNAPQGVDSGKVDAVLKALKDCSKDRAALEAQLGLLLQSLWTDSLRVVEEILKHKPGEPGVNNQLFQAYKSRILNEGNRLKRQLPIILGDFVVHQMFEREVTTRVVAKGEGPWNLPPGVKHPSERRG